MLKVKIETVHRVKWSDLERFATEVYGLDDYNFCCVQECGNDSQHRFIAHDTLSQTDKREADAIRTTKQVPSYRNALLIDMLCTDGHMGEGTYLVEVCW